ncbi:hypothetical protein ACH3VR_04950, partial [Microbacterium sp. B2969]
AGNNWSSHGGPSSSATTRAPQELTPRYGTHPLGVSTPRIMTSTRGTLGFHQELRRIYRDSKSIRGYLAELSSFVRARVWDGKLPSGVSPRLRAADAGLAIYIDDTVPRGDVTMGDLSNVQARAKNEMLTNIAALG